MRDEHDQNIHLFFSLGTFNFTARDWTVISGFKLMNVLLGDDIIISCATNDPQAQVKLLRSQMMASGFEDATIHFKDRMTQSGSYFTLNIKTLFDGGFFKCMATDDKGKNEITMELGELRINYGKSNRLANSFEIYFYEIKTKVS